MTPAPERADPAANATYPIRDQNAKPPAPFEQILRSAGIHAMPTGVRMPRMNAIMERRAQTRPGVRRQGRPIR